MPSLTQWLQRFVDEVRTPVPTSPATPTLDQSLAAAFVTAPADQPASPPLALGGDLLLGPTRATPPRPTHAATLWSAAPRATAAAAGPAWPSAASPRSTATGAPGPTGGGAERPSHGALAALAAAFGNPRPANGASPPGVPITEWPTPSRPASRAPGTFASPPVTADPPDLATPEWSTSPRAQRTEPAPSHPASSELAVLPLAELLRDLVPASPFEARLESLWQQRASPLAGGTPPGGTDGGWPETAGSPPAVDWSDLASRLADLEAGQGG
jgi:hypothetical protein